MKNKLNTIWKYIAGGATILDYQAFYDSYSSKNNMIQLQNNITDLKNNVIEIDKKIENTINPEVKEELISQVQDIKNFINTLEKKHNYYFEQHTGLLKDSDSSKKKSFL